MKIGMILLDHSFPDDIRVEKEVKVLVKEKYNVSILTVSKSKEDEINEKYLNNIKIISKAIDIKGSFGKLINLSYFTLIYKEYVSAVCEYLENENPDVVHVHDFTFLPTVFYALKKLKKNKPVIADLHENMPAALVVYRSNKKWFNKIIDSLKYNYFVWRFKEKKYLNMCDKVITVVPEANDRLYKYGIPKKDIFIISNTENKNTFKFEKEDVNKKITNKYKDQFVVSYIGGIGPHRGINTALKSLKEIRDKIPNLKMLIVGAKENHFLEINRFLEKNNLLNYKNNIEILGWLPFKDVNSYVMASDICLVPHENYEHTQTTVPHKLFQYMICKRPVLVSDCRPLKRIVGNNNAGSVFRSGDSVDMAEKIINMYNDPKTTKKYAENGYELATSSFSWDNDAKRLIELYNGYYQS